MDEKKRLLVASSSSSGAMEKQGIGGVEQKQQEEEQEPPLVQLGQSSKCPRCDSSNTKFCYYNNYSLSQPRHFCKACKRYWTRGGTLRNVPVGGGCRKNKRLKIIRPSVTGHHQVLASTNNHIANPMMLSGSSRLSISRVVEEATGGLGFSSAGQLLHNGHDFLHNYYSSSSYSSLASTIEDKKFTISTGGDLQLKDEDSSGLSTAMNKKVQGRQINYNMINYPFGNGIGGWNNYLGYQMEEQQVIGSSSTTTDPNYYWSISNANTTPSNNWHDPPPANTHESPVPSFI